MRTNEIQSGSLKELWNLSYPLMISFLSLFTMVFVDRIFLSFYSTDALNAATSAGTLSWSIILGFSTLAGLSEVFVAQYNGARQFDRLGEPIWQMIWFSLLTFLFFIPLGIFVPKILYGPLSPTNYEHQFFRYTMFVSSFPVLLATLTAFFVGQGKTAIIKWLGLLGNITNILFDWILIFGVKNWIPAMGVKGACIATVIGIGVQIAILLFLFLKQENRLHFGTMKWKFNSELFLGCIKVGLPPAIFAFIELFGWSLFYTMMTMVSSTHILVSSICQSILLLFVFFGLGLEKGSAVVAGNLLGANKSELISKLFRSGLKLLSVFSIFIFLFFFIFPDFLVNLFLNNSALEASTSAANFSAEYLEALRVYIKQGLWFIAIYMILEDARWFINGILTAAGDTLFLMIAGACCVWLFLLLPTYVFIVKAKGSILLAFFIWVVYSFISMVVFYLRFKQGKWKERSLVIEESSND
jgi:MATE family multidrug resistance protein